MTLLACSRVRRVLREGETKANQGARLYSGLQFHQQFHDFCSANRCHVLLKSRCLRTFEEEPFRGVKYRQTMRCIFERLPAGLRR